MINCQMQFNILLSIVFLIRKLSSHRNFHWYWELLADSWATFRLIYDRYKFCGALRVHAISARQQLICLLAVCVAWNVRGISAFLQTASKFLAHLARNPRVYNICITNFSFYAGKKKLKFRYCDWRRDEKMFIDTLLLLFFIIIIFQIEILVCREETCRDNKKMRIIVAGRGFVFVAD